MNLGIDGSAGRDLFIDANLLLLRVIGGLRRELPAKFTRTAEYQFNDVIVLEQLCSLFRRTVVTAHVLTEVSNLLGHLQGPDRTAARLLLADSSFPMESLVPAVDAGEEPCFARLGLTDAALVRMSREGAVVVTADDDAYAAVLAAGGTGLNFRHRLHW